MDAPVQILLGQTYSPHMWDLRKRVIEARASATKLVFVTLRAPINSDVIDVALESGSLYLIGVRAHRGSWFEFYPDAAPASPAVAGSPVPRLPGSRWIMAGGKKALPSYRALRLSRNVRDAPGATGSLSYAGRPADLLRLFHHWDGRIGAYHINVALCALIFVVCEALRFRSIETLCWHWARGYKNLPGGAQTQMPVLTITTAMLDTVQNWSTSAVAGDPDIWTWPPDQLDRLIC